MMREQKTVWSWSFAAGTITTHNNNHSHTLRPSCPICRIHGTAWLRVGVPENILTD